MIWRCRYLSILAPLAGCDHLLHVFQRYEHFFQSSHPWRGATLSGFAKRPHHPSFNPRTPGGVRHISGKAVNRWQNFQSSHPWRGATQEGRSDGYLLDLSILAPLAGCDPPPPTPPHVARSFNPRTPGGVRHRYESRIWFSIVFQSSHPWRGATRQTPATATPTFFQSSHPWRGATLFASIKSSSRIFQSSHPWRGATIVVVLYRNQILISILAPLAGCDY